MIGNGPTRPLWIIARQDNGQMQVLTLRHKNRETLPIFSFEDEAEMFLQLETPETCWRARETTPGEIVSLLYGPCASVKSVALDPLPVVDGNLMCRGRNKFIQYIVNGHQACQKLVSGIHESTDPSILLEEDGALDANEQRAKADRHRILESVGEAANGKNNTSILDPPCSTSTPSTSRAVSREQAGTGTTTTLPEETLRT